ncbi:hypothetical protein [uncultured Prevotella sp.]|uniref:hypothetical protein n=1 Tax=uncultured Prevotella sp. TaxID=159272 RepID=UPI00265D607D|nr:hypothetical protein [uncultured Prevotella sp.]
MNRIYCILIIAMTLLVFNVADAKKKKYPNGDYYEGKWKKGMPNGLGTMTYANGDVYYGNWYFGLKEGQGTMTYANDSTYKEYIGEWKEDKPDGKGRMTFSNNNIYDGDWVLGQMEGQGTMTYADDNPYKEYVGEWKGDKPDGKGKMTFKNNNEYDGDWVLGQMEGQGKMILSDSSVYDGSWINGQMEGQGTMTYKNGDVFLGIFNATGRIGKLTEINGNWYDGEWKGDKFYNGKCYFNKGEDTQFEGEIKNGKCYNGKGVLKGSGNSYDGTWTNGKFVGECELKGHYFLPKFVGSINENGNMYGTAYYGDSMVYKGTLSSRFTPYDTGKLSILKNNSVVGEIDGVWENGVLSKLNSGVFTVGQQSFNLRMENDKLIIEDEYYTISKHYDKLPGALKKLYTDYDYIVSNGLTEQNKLFKEKFKGKAFVCITRLNKLEPELAMFLDISSIDVYVIIGMENGYQLVESTVAMVNTDRLKYSNRGYLIQQYDVAKKYLKVNRYDYRINNGYIQFNSKKYKLINNSSALYNETNGITLKMTSLKEAEQSMNNYLKRLTK